MIFSSKRSAYDAIKEAHVGIHAIEKLQPPDHQKLRQREAVP